jgi:hypothetical protein
MTVLPVGPFPQASRPTNACPDETDALLTSFLLSLAQKAVLDGVGNSPRTFINKLFFSFVIRRYLTDISGWHLQIKSILFFSVLDGILHKPLKRSKESLN